MHYTQCYNYTGQLAACAFAPRRCCTGSSCSAAAGLSGADSSVSSVVTVLAARLMEN